MHTPEVTASIATEAAIPSADEDETPDSSLKLSFPDGPAMLLHACVEIKGESDSPSVHLYTTGSENDAMSLPTLYAMGSTPTNLASPAATTAVTEAPSFTHCLTKLA